MVPKTASDGSFSRDASGMRPITVLPELGKLLQRVLAARIGTSLLLHPKTLTAAQRAFIKDGYLAQCIDVSVDVIEDWRQANRGRLPPGVVKVGGRRRARGGKRVCKDLFVLSYDQSKAYDSVQAYTIRASLERFNMPEPFIEYTLSSLDGAKSRVRTSLGLTDRFRVMSSVRQGDPLAPIIYIFITDALHRGFEINPLFPEECKRWGYTFAGRDRDGSVVRICSSGYADDSIVFAEDPRHLEMMHAWVREFFGAHSFKLNCKKTKLLSSYVGPCPPVLPSVDGRDRVQAPAGGPLPRRASPSSSLPDPETIRYLGAWLNLDLDWKTQVARMDRSVHAVCASIRTNKFDLFMSAFAVKQYLLPRLRIGLESARISEATIERWDRMVRRAVYLGAGMTMGRDLSGAAFYVGTGIPCLQDHRWAIRGEELLVRLNSRGPSSSTCWARVGHLLGGDCGGCPAGAAVVGKAAQNRAAETLTALSDKFHATLVVGGSDAIGASTIVTQPTVAGASGTFCDWRPHLLPSLRVLSEHEVVPAGDGVDRAVAYTDGSTGKDWKLPTGCSVIMDFPGREEQFPRVTHGFPCGFGGNNFVAELAAILGAITMVPEHVDLDIFTDSQASIGAINKFRLHDRSRPGCFLNRYAISQRRRVLSAARPLMNCIRAAIECRSGRVDLSHVKAHSGGLDHGSVMNALADAEANRVRLEAAEAGPPFPTRRLAGEERVRVAGAGGMIIGSFREAFLRRAERKWLDVLGALPHQGRLAREYPKGIVSMLRMARHSRCPNLLRFAVLAVTEWLPTERRLWRRDPGGDNAGRGQQCKLCGGVSETVLHALTCCTHAPSVASRQVAVARAVAKVAGDHAGSAAGLGTVIPAWFDPSGSAKIRVHPSVNSETLDRLCAHDPLAGILGILPIDVEAVLEWEPDSSVMGGWRRRELGEIQDLAQELRATLCRGAAAAYITRCRGLRAWWHGAEGRGHWQALATKLAKRKHKRQRDARAAAPPPKRRKRSPPTAVPAAPLRRSPFVHRQREFFAPYLTDVTVEELEVEALHDLGRRKLSLPWW